MRKIILFLDIDGVLLDPKVKRKHPSKSGLAGYTKWFDQAALNNLHQFISEIESRGDQVGIVISSSWRERQSIPELKDLFNSFQFSKNIIGKTDDLVCISDENFEFSDALVRAEEIDLWLRENNKKMDIDQFVILDDYDDSLSELFKDNFVQCKNELFGVDELKKALSVVNGSFMKLEAEVGLPLNWLHLTIYNETKARSEISVKKEVRISSAKRSKYISLFFQNELKLDDQFARMVASYDSP